MWKKVFTFAFCLLPSALSAAAPFLVAGLVGVGVIAGFSIYRSVAPVDMASALDFFSSCWSCEMFGGIMGAMSDILPRVFSAIGAIAIPIAVALTAVWFAWRLLSGYLGIGKPPEPWDIAGGFGTHILKLGLCVALFAAPLPRMINDIVVEPVFNVGMSLNRVVGGDEKFNACVIATAINDTETLANGGAYSPKLRHNLTCELATVHQMTGLGMTAGWTMLNMSFNHNYMHKIADTVPVFPNVPIFFAGMLILVLFFFALLPIPLYFLQVFIMLSLDLIMLPLMLLGWLFADWKIVDWGGKNIMGIINDLIKNAAGIAMVGIFISFAALFMNTMFGDYGGASAMAAAIANNDATILMDGLMMRNDSFITILLIGLFIAMFMSLSVKLVGEMFKNVAIPDKFYDNVKKDINTIWGNMKKWYDGVKKSRR